MASTTTDRISGISTSVAVKAPVYAATTANITLSGAQTVDTFTPPEGARILVRLQTDPIENGIYDYSSTTAWQRADDFAGARDAVAGTLVIVNNISASQRTYRVSGFGVKIPGTDAITFAQASLLDVDFSVAGIALVEAADVAAERVLLGIDADLAAPSGSALVGDILPGTGAVARTVAGKLSDRINLLDFVDNAVIPHASIKNGTNTINLSPFFQAAVNRIKDLGGGTLDCCGLSVFTTAVIDILGAHNLTILAHGANFTTSGGTHFTFQNGTQSFATALTYRTLTGVYVPGDTSVTLNTPADAAYFTDNDYVYIRASQDASGLTDQPIAEINKVISGNAVTGILVFSRPLTKKYSLFGSYPYGVAVANSLITENFRVLGGRFRNSGARAFQLLHMVNSHLRPELIAGRGGPIMRGLGVSCEDARIEITPNWGAPLWRPYFWGVDTGTSYSSFRRNTCVSTGVGFVHLHEGQSNASVSDNTFELGKTDAAATEQWPVISIRGRSWNSEVKNNRIINSPNNDAIIVGNSSVEPTEGHDDINISGNTISGSVAGFGINMYDPVAKNARIIGNDIQGYTTTSLRVASTGGVIAGNTVPAGTSIIATGNTVSGNVNILDTKEFIGVESMSPLYNSPVLTSVFGGRALAYIFPDAIDKNVSLSKIVPPGARRYDLSIYWTNNGAGAGDVTWAAILGGFADTNDMNVADTTVGTFTGAAPALGIVSVSAVVAGGLLSNADVAAGDYMRLRIQRNGTAAGDTLSNDAALIGVLVRFYG